MEPSVQRRAAQMAIELLGGVYGVCAYLGVDPEDVYGWMTGGAAMPRETFLKIIDVVCENLSGIEQRAVEEARRVGSAAPSDDAAAMLKAISQRR
jgi:hypothetical protein